MEESEYEKRRERVFAKMNKLIDIIEEHIENEDCQHCRDYLREGWELR